MSDTTTCPMATLVSALDAGELPPLTWAVANSVEGVDPVHVAWERATNPRAMLAFLAKSCGLHAARAGNTLLVREKLVTRWRFVGAGYPVPYFGDGYPVPTFGPTVPNELPEKLAMACLALRAGFPVPPTLSEAMTSWNMPDCPLF